MSEAILKHGSFKTAELKPHEHNNFYFDDMSGEKWQEFLKSVREHGVINPPVITEDGRIISGHQRIRACRELGINEVECCVKTFESEQAEDIALIESNLRQRGVINSPSVKLGRILRTLEIVDGATVDGKQSRFKVSGDKRKEIYRKLKIDRKTACRARGLAGMPERLQEMTIAGNIGTTAAYDNIIKLSQAEQEELARRLIAGDSYTGREIKAMIAALPDAEKLEALEEKIKEAHELKEETELSLREKLTETQRRERRAYEALQAEKKAHRKTEQAYERRMEKQEEFMLDYLQQTDTEIIIGACQALCRALQPLQERRETLERGDAYDCIMSAAEALEGVRERFASNGKGGQE